MRDVVFVVGMGRSGSSALTRVLSLCGPALALRNLPANAGNPTGYWEPERAVAMNEEYLSAHSSSWYDADVTLQCDPPDAVASAQFMSAIAEFLNTEFPSNASVIVVKEPRISALLPLWIRATRDLGFSPKFIHVLRNPDAVAASLAARDCLTPDHSFALWLKYNLVAERETRGAPRIIVSFEDLMRDWQTVISDCIAALKLEARVTRNTRAAVADFLTPELYHHRGTSAYDNIVATPLRNWAAQTYDVLRNAGGGSFAALDRTWLQYVDWCRLMPRYLRPLMPDYGRAAAGTSPGSSD